MQLRVFPALSVVCVSLRAASADGPVQLPSPVICESEASGSRGGHRRQSSCFLDGAQKVVTRARRFRAMGLGYGRIRPVFRIASPKNGVRGEGKTVKGVVFAVIKPEVLPIHLI